jgi:hypothetical protein
MENIILTRGVKEGFPAAKPDKSAFASPAGGCPFDLGLHVTSAGPASRDLAPGVPDLALMGLAVTTVGACRRILDLVVTHVKQRHQFASQRAAVHAVPVLLE